MSEEVTRRNFLITMGGLASSLIFKGEQAPNQFLDPLSEVAGSYNANWRFYEEKAKSLLESTYTEGLAPQFERMAFDFKGPQAEIRITKSEVAVSIKGKYPQQNSEGLTEWTEREIAYKEALNTIREPNFIEISYTSKHYNCNLYDNPIQELVQAGGLSLEQKPTEKSLTVRLSKSVVPGSSEDVFREVVTEYVLAHEPEKVSLRVNSSDVPDGFNTTQKQTFYGLRKGDTNLPNISNETMTEATEVLENAFQEFASKA